MGRSERIRILLAVSMALGLVLIPGPVVRAEAGDPVIGDPFTVFTGNLDDLNPAVAYNSQRREFLVAWEWMGNIHGRIVTLHGGIGVVTLIFDMSGSNHNPDVAYNSCADQYLIVWDDSTNTWGARLDGSSTIPGGRFSIAGGTSPAVAFNNNPSYCDYLVVWEEYYWIFGGAGAGPHKGVWGQRVAGTSGSGDSGGGELIGAEFEVQDDDQNHHFYYEPDVAYNLSANEYLVVYTYDPSRGSNAADRDVLGRRITGHGQLQGQQTTIDSSLNAQEKPAVAANHLNATTPYLVSYDDYWVDASGDVSAMRLSANGSVAAWLPVAAVAGRQEVESDVASEVSGGYLVVWSVYPWTIYGRRVDNTGIMGPDFCVSVRCVGILALSSGDHRDPAVAGGSPVGLAVWEDNGWATGNGSWDIAGQLLGYRTHLPLVLRSY